MTSGILYGVSVGPGDPDLITVKAIRTIESADVVAVPNTGGRRQVAWQIAKSYAQGKDRLDCRLPMERDPQARAVAYRRIADSLCELLKAGKSVAYLCLGDVGVYASFGHIRKLVRARGYTTESIPGVTSFCAAAARMDLSLCSGNERLLIAPCAPGANLNEVLGYPATKVLMKAGRNIGALRDKLAEHGQLAEACMVENCGMSDERIYPTLDDPACADAGYMSVVIVGENRAEA